MSVANFYSPEAARPLYGEIVPAYQAAFAGEPWFEVSKCPDERQRCVGGLSSVAIGALCEQCGACPALPAYEADELCARFEAMACTRPTAWYIERPPAGVALAAVAWRAAPSMVAREKYSDVPPMSDWLAEVLGAAEISWLDEVFANKAVRPGGNLQQFDAMCDGFMALFQTDVLAFRTINPRMVAAVRRAFPDRSVVFGHEVDVPDRRDFVIMRSKQ